jgi:hypothetical protein
MDVPDEELWPRAIIGLALSELAALHPGSTEAELLDRLAGGLRFFDELHAQHPELTRAELAEKLQAAARRLGR